LSAVRPAKIAFMTAFFTHLFKPSVQRIVQRALALPPRGAVQNDVLILHSLLLSGHCLKLEWRARDTHPWDRDLPAAQQAELFSKQALQDTDAALIRLFQRLSEIEQIEFQVLKPDGFGDVILGGVVDRARVLDPEQPLSLRMRLRMLGVTYQMADDHLVLLPANSWVSPLAGAGHRIQKISRPACHPLSTGGPLARSRKTQNVRRPPQATGPAG
jgi:hypothetical protein